MRALTDDLTPEQRELLTDVEENGVHVVHVPEAGGRPGWSYTVGLWTSFEQPEVVVFGLPEDVAEELLQTVTDEADEGRRFRDGEKHDGLLVDYAARFVDVPKQHVTEHLPDAVWAHEGDDFPCVQLVWPDKNRRWPWEDGARESFRKGQPVLGRPAP